MSTYHVILAGGGGTRLWPLSTNATPKQFMEIGEGKTLLDHALDRIEACGATDMETMISTIEGFEKHIHPILGKRGKNIHLITEPARKNTAAAYAYMLVNLVFHGAKPEDVVMVNNSDHLISPLESFARYIQAGVDAANTTHNIVIFGIQITFPHTGLGYIQTGKNYGEYSEIVAFREKPDFETAQTYMLQGGYLWNSGMYMGRIADFEREFREHCPEIGKLFDAKSSEEAREIYLTLPEMQIDIAISEKTNRICVVPMHLLWSDVGTWDCLYSVSELSEEHRNTVRGEVIMEDVHNSLVWNTDDRPVVIEGVDDIVVVQTPHATYIGPRTKPSKIKKLLEKVPKERR